MLKKAARKLVRNFYLLALLLNVFIPWIFAILIVGNSKGEIQLMYVAVGVWSIAAMLLYIIYFAIPDFLKNWERIATFLFPTLFCCPLLYYSTRFLMIPLIINLLFNVACMLYYKRKIMKQVKNQ